MKIKPWEDLHGLQRDRMGQILGITNLDRLFPGGGILQLEGICYVGVMHIPSSKKSNWQT